MVDLRLSPTGISIREIMGIGGLTISYSKKGLLHFAWVGFVRGAGLRTFPFLQARNLCLQYRNHKAVFLPLWFQECRRCHLSLQNRKSASMPPARDHVGTATCPGPRLPRTQPRKAAGSAGRLPSTRAECRSITILITHVRSSCLGSG